MRKIIFKPASFMPLGQKRAGRFREAQKPKASRKPWRVKRAATIWFVLFCAYGSATAALQCTWDAGFEVLKGVLVEGIVAGFVAATAAAFICIAHNRKWSAKYIRRSATPYGARLERLRLYFTSPGDVKVS